MAKKGEVKEITETAEGAGKEFAGSGIEGTKGEVVRGEDVIKTLRDKGHAV